MRVERASGLPAELARRTFGVLRPTDAAAVYARPRQEFARLADRGLLRKVVTGYYAVVPPHPTDRNWLPGLESVAYGISAADYGPDATVLMGLSAARLLGAIPRALAVAVVAVRRTVPTSRWPIGTRSSSSSAATPPAWTPSCFAPTSGVRLLPRSNKRCWTWRTVLVSGASRTRTVHAAVRALWPRADAATLDKLAGEQRLRAALRRARSWTAE